MKNVLEFFENSVEKYPDKVAFEDMNKSLTYRELEFGAKRLGSYLLTLKKSKTPVAIYLDKSVEVIMSMLGVVYSGNFYTVIDSEMPLERIKKIFSTLQPSAIVSDEKHKEAATALCDNVFLIEDAENCEVKEEKLLSVRETMIDTDVLYVLYTSGSTGTPKGAVITHRNVISYISWAVKTFSFDENTVFGNQTPFYFSMSVTDVFSTLMSGATLVIIPKICFLFPIKLLEVLNNYKINTIYWVPSAFGIAANFKLFEEDKPKYLKKVLFAGEVMPLKFLNYWRRNLPDDTLFANLFGPTETTDICSYYIVDREFGNDETLPIGRHCDNCDVFIVNSEGKEAKTGEEGELYARGSFLSPGYYNNPEKTKAAFVQNPLNNSYPEICYKTGDLVKLNELGEIIYITRKDFQIKKMGYRIELGEIEAAAGSVEKVRECACVFDKENEKIVLFYSAKKLTEKELMTALKEKLNSYLLPDKIIKIPSLPHNQNGKTDRKNLEKRINDGKDN